MLKRAASIVASGVRLIVLLALSDDGAPAYDHGNAAALAALGCPVFACTPEQFPPFDDRRERAGRRRRDRRPSLHTRAERERPRYGRSPTMRLPLEVPRRVW